MSDDEYRQDPSSRFGDYKLVLQSVVCHRGVAVDSGHYISLVRGDAPNAHPADGSSERRSSTTGDEASAKWLRQDDLAPERVQLVDMAEALRHESPYILFYQIQPIHEELLPPYSRSTPASEKAETETLTRTPERMHECMLLSAETTSSGEKSRPSIEIVDWQRSNSVDLSALSTMTDYRNGPEGSSTSSNRRNSIAHTDGSATSASYKTSTEATTPSDQAGGGGGGGGISSKTGYLGLSHKNSRGGGGGGGGKRGSRKSSDHASRPSEGGSSNNMLGLTMSKISAKLSSREKASNASEAAVVVVIDGTSSENLSAESVSTVTGGRGKRRRLQKVEPRTCRP